MTQRVGLIGLGAIGRAVVRITRERFPGEIDIVGALVRDPARPRQGGPTVVGDLAALLGLRPEVVVEVAGHEALRAHGPVVLRAGLDLIAVSVGALADPVVEERLRAAARAGGARLRIASGAIGALDAIAAAAIGGLERVTHTTRKPARTLLALEEAVALKAEREVFRGPAREGVRLFPESVNVAAAVSLAGLGLDRTELRIIADPTIERNRHEVVALGAFGTLRFEIANVPSDDNPRTGRIVALSVVHELLARRASVAIG